MDIKKVLIIGFGRMGLTHYSILNKILPKAEFHIVETNRKIQRLFKKNFPNIIFHEYKDKAEIEKYSFDLTLITTPPFAHLGLIENSLARNDNRIFVEKPFGGHRNVNFENDKGNIFIGYVLRYNSCIQWVKTNIAQNEIKSISGSYFSNTIQAKPKGWRNGVYSGVLNEMGSHIIDLIHYFINLEDFKLEFAETKSIFSDVDDIVKARLSDGTRQVNLHFNWVDKRFRKPEFLLILEHIEGDLYHIDQQKITIRRGDEIIKTIYISDLNESIPYYLRGIDFTKQMMDLIENRDISSKDRDGIIVNRIMNQILTA